MRTNMRPTDHNGVAGPFSDPRVDTNGDGIIARIYQQATGTPPAVGTIVNGANPDPTDIKSFNSPAQSAVYESLSAVDRNGVATGKDLDGNGLWGDDDFGSNVDMNRNFDYLWNFHDVSVIPNLGANAWTSAGPDAASEPEVKAVQNFLITHPVAALVDAAHRRAVGAVALVLLAGPDHGRRLHGRHGRKDGRRLVERRPGARCTT